MMNNKINEYIKSVKWQFAKTMPEIPHDLRTIHPHKHLHEYTIADWQPVNRNQN